MKILLIDPWNDLSNAGIPQELKIKYEVETIFLGQKAGTGDVVVSIPLSLDVLAEILPYEDIPILCIHWNSAGHATCIRLKKTGLNVTAVRLDLDPKTASRDIEEAAEKVLATRLAA